VLRLAPMNGGGILQRHLAGDIWFTPMRVILSDDLVVRDAWPSDQVPQESDLRLLCSQPVSRDRLGPAYPPAPKLSPDSIRQAGTLPG
jgi:hypothetical protein